MPSHVSGMVIGLTAPPSALLPLVTRLLSCHAHVLSMHGVDELQRVRAAIGSQPRWLPRAATPSQQARTVAEMAADRHGRLDAAIAFGSRTSAIRWLMPMMAAQGFGVLVLVSGAQTCRVVQGVTVLEISLEGVTNPVEALTMLLQQASAAHHFLPTGGA